MLDASSSDSRGLFVTMRAGPCVQADLLPVRIFQKKMLEPYGGAQLRCTPQPNSKRGGVVEIYLHLAGRNIFPGGGMSVYTDIWNNLEFSPRYPSSGNADIQRNRLNFKAKAVFQKRGLCTRAAPGGAQSLLRPALPHTTECPGPRSPLRGGQGPAGSRGRGAERSGAAAAVAAAAPRRSAAMAQPRPGGGPEAAAGGGGCSEEDAGRCGAR